ncbi:hypothetical protein RKT74_05460 [Leclercia pneumoniae]|uniref:hypothetical protein n=1 Tax=Leclercia pneumoniae TaxID=2815358 RepID=UPI0021E59430|nr:hypothetical protein [Leclercia pneumoniae]MCV2510917.1 hypothetical protein [Leclercia pneumoniae]WNN82263.1 hypothetical protein RKT74_05460 [Leclercia pneumoniae]
MSGSALITIPFSALLDLWKNKYNAVFVNKLKRFEVVKTTSEIKRLISYMSSAALEKAEQKIKRSKKRDKLNSSQMQMTL